MEPVKIRVIYDVSASERDADAFFGKFGTSGVYNRNLAEAGNSLNKVASYVEHLGRTMGLSEKQAELLLRRSIQLASQEERAFNQRERLLSQWAIKRERHDEEIVNNWYRSQLKEEKVLESSLDRKNRLLTSWGVRRANHDDEVVNRAFQALKKEEHQFELAQSKKEHILEMWGNRRITHDQELYLREQKLHDTFLDRKLAAEKKYNQEVLQGTRIALQNAKILQQMEATVGGTNGRLAPPIAVGGRTSRGLMDGLVMGSPGFSNVAQYGLAGGIGFGVGIAAVTAIGRLTSALREGGRAWLEYAMHVEQAEVGMNDYGKLIWPTSAA